MDPEATAWFQEVSSESRATTRMMTKLPEYLAKREDQMKSCFPACRLGKAKRPHQVSDAASYRQGGLSGCREYCYRMY